jgi:type IV pilus assembly protein PilV
VPQVRHAGFAMLDVLVALLLLAITLTGACATLIQTMRATHGALLATRAVDLAADLSEELRGAASEAEASTLLATWRTRASVVLPVADLEPEDFAALVRILPAGAEASTADAVDGYLLTLRWQGAPGGAAREMAIPIAATWHGSTP